MSLERGLDIELYGIDISKSTIDYYTTNSLKYNVEVGDISKARHFKSINFNLVYSITVIEYIPFYLLNKAFKNIYSLLSKGGIFYLTFPHGRSIIDLIKNPGYTRYPISYIIKKLENIGFIIQDSGPVCDNSSSKIGPGSYVLARKI